MNFPVSYRMIGLLWLALLLAACGGGSTGGGVGGPGGGGTPAANANLAVLAIACSDASLSSCNNMQLEIPEGHPPVAAGFQPGAVNLIDDDRPPLSDYTSLQSNLADSITITPTAANSSAGITVNGVAVTSGQASQAIPLQVGSGNVITIVVTAVNGTTTRTYRITVTRLANNNAELTGLVLSTGTLAPNFSRSVLGYTSVVDFTVQNLRVTANSAEPAATIEIAGQVLASGAQSNLIPLVVGANPIEVVVTALDDTTTLTYTITVTRRGSVNLSALSANVQTNPPALPDGVFALIFDPLFDPASVVNSTYSSTAENQFEHLVVTATAVEPVKAAIRIVRVEGETETDVDADVGSGVPSDPIDLEIGENRFRIIVTHPDSGGENPLTRTYNLFVTRQEPPNFTFEAFLKPFDDGTNARLHGFSLAISADGTTAAVGAPGEEGGRGAVYVYVLSGGDWITQQRLTIGPDAERAFGRSVALSGDGNLLAVGAPQGDLNDDGDLDDVGRVDEDTLDSGAVYTWARNGGNWTLQDTLKPGNKSDVVQHFYGTSVALSPDGLTLAVGSPRESSNQGGIQHDAEPPYQDDAGYGSGAVYVYACIPGNACGFQAFIKVPEPRSRFAPGQTAEERFGLSLALNSDGNRLAIGMPGYSVVSANPPLRNAIGAGLVYMREAGVWQSPAEVLTALRPRPGHLFGWSLALSGDGDVLAIGELGHIANTRGIWNASNPNVLDGQSVSGPEVTSGAAHVFVRDAGDEEGPEWVQQTFVKPLTSAAITTEGFGVGYSVALSADGNTVVIGVPGESSAATRIDGNRINGAAPSSGAAYVLTRDEEGDWSLHAYVKVPNSRAGILNGWSVALSGDAGVLGTGAPGEGGNASGVIDSLPLPINNAIPGRGAAYLFHAVPPEP